MVNAIEDLSDKIKIAFGRLLKDADPVSKKVLTVFDSSKDSDVNIRNVTARASRPELDTLAKYLKIPLVGEAPKNKTLYSTKAKISKRIVLEIRSLYPSICPECNEEYTVMPGDQPKLRCWICLQGSHECEESRSKMKVHLDHQSQLSGLVWLCSDCVTLNNPFPEGDDTGSTSKITTPSKQDKESGAKIPEPHKGLSEKAAVALQNGVSTEESTVASEQVISDEKLEDSELTDELEEQQQNISESKPNSCAHVCPRLINNSCPHGVAGDKEADGKDKCSLFHPKRCRSYMAHYTSDTRGCTKGEECDKLHVNLCKTSIETKKCMDVNCTLMHLSGTKRPKSLRKKKKALAEQGDNTEKVETKKSAAPTLSKPKPGKTDQKTDQKSKKTMPKKESFLGSKSLLDSVQATVAAAVKDAMQREMAPMREELDKYKRQLETLKDVPSNLPLPNQPMAYGHPYRQMPFGTCQYMCQQRERYPSQSYQNWFPPGITPIPPACF